MFAHATGLADILGAPTGTYVFLSSLVDDLVKKAAGDVSKLEEFLGLSPDYLGNQPIRIDVPNPTGLQMTNGNVAGASAQWIPGGYSSGGIAEAVIDPPSPKRFALNPNTVVIRGAFMIPVYKNDWMGILKRDEIEMSIRDRERATSIMHDAPPELRYQNANIHPQICKTDG